MHLECESISVILQKLNDQWDNLKMHPECELVSVILLELHNWPDNLKMHPASESVIYFFLELTWLIMQHDNISSLWGLQSFPCQHNSFFSSFQNQHYNQVAKFISAKFDVSCLYLKPSITTYQFQKSSLTVFTGLFDSILVFLLLSLFCLFLTLCSHSHLPRELLLAPVRHYLIYWFLPKGIQIIYPNWHKREGGDQP